MCWTLFTIDRCVIGSGVSKRRQMKTFVVFFSIFSFWSRWKNVYSGETKENLLTNISKKKGEVCVLWIAVRCSNRMFWQRSISKQKRWTCASLNEIIEIIRVNKSYLTIKRKGRRNHHHSTLNHNSTVVQKDVVNNKQTHKHKRTNVVRQKENKEKLTVVWRWNFDLFDFSLIRNWRHNPSHELPTVQQYEVPWFVCDTLTVLLTAKENLVSIVFKVKNNVLPNKSLVLLHWCRNTDLNHCKEKVHALY